MHNSFSCTQAKILLLKFHIWITLRRCYFKIKGISNKTRLSWGAGEHAFKVWLVKILYVLLVSFPFRVPALPDVSSTDLTFTIAHSAYALCRNAFPPNRLLSVREGGKGRAPKSRLQDAWCSTKSNGSNCESIVRWKRQTHMKPENCSAFDCFPFPQSAGNYWSGLCTEHRNICALGLQLSQTLVHLDV